MMQSACWSERNLSELNELLELARRTEQKIRELSSLTTNLSLEDRLSAVENAIATMQEQISNSQPIN